MKEEEVKELEERIDPERVPRHIAIIMDGNGRWARERTLPRAAGHRVGMESVRTAVRACGQLGVEVLTLYAFSSENWRRPPKEVRFLMGLLRHYLRKEVEELDRERVSVRAIGHLEELPREAQEELERARKRTEHNQGLILNLALNYGGRREIVDAAQRFASRVRAGEEKPEELDEQGFSRYLYTHDLPDPDLLIRTSGEQRLSNFLLWQLSYAELYVTPCYWPDFRRGELLEAILEYQKRERRYGKIAGAQAAPEG